MRRLSDLLAGEPLALTGAITATGNLLFTSGIINASPEVIASLNVAVGAWLGLLRWVVVPVAAAREQAATAATAGYDRAVADVHELAAAPAATPVRKPAKKS